MTVPLIGAAVGGGILGGLLGNLLPFSAAGRILETTWNQLFPNVRLDPSVLVTLRLLKVITEEDYLKHMKIEGYTEGRALSMLLTSSNWLDTSSIVRAGWREKKTDVEIVSDLTAHGWIKEEAERFLTAARYYPSPGELVNWQAKEVFEPEMVEQYGLDAELGEVEREAFYKAGMDDTQIENFWRAHWVHPGWNQVQEMFHREQLTLEETKRWFRVVEIPPYWREKLINVAYQPYTRVDVRRMHKLGVLDEKDLKRAYMDLGYDEEKAGNMVKFTIEYNKSPGVDPDRDLTRSILEKGYRLGLLNANEFGSMLESLGYSKDNANFLRTILDQDLSIDRAYDWISLLRSNVGAGLLSPLDAERKLEALGLDDAAVSHYGQLFAAYAEEPSKIPSKTDIKNWVAHEIITVTKGEEYLKQLGYTDDVIHYYMIDWLGSEERYREWVGKMKAIAKEV